MSARSTRFVSRCRRSVGYSWHGYITCGHEPLPSNRARLYRHLFLGHEPSAPAQAVHGASASRAVRVCFRRHEITDRAGVLVPRRDREHARVERAATRSSRTGVVAASSARDYGSSRLAVSDYPRPTAGALTDGRPSRREPGTLVGDRACQRCRASRRMCTNADDPRLDGDPLRARRAKVKSLPRGEASPCSRPGTRSRRESELFDLSCSRAVGPSCAAPFAGKKSFCAGSRRAVRRPVHLRDVLPFKLSTSAALNCPGCEADLDLQPFPSLTFVVSRTSENGPCIVESSRYRDHPQP